MTTPHGLALRLASAGGGTSLARSPRLRSLAHEQRLRHVGFGFLQGRRHVLRQRLFDGRAPHEAEPAKARDEFGVDAAELHEGTAGFLRSRRHDPSVFGRDGRQVKRIRLDRTQVGVIMFNMTVM